MKWTSRKTTQVVFHPDTHRVQHIAARTGGRLISRPEGPRMGARRPAAYSSSCLGTRLVNCVASQLKSVSANPGNVPSLHCQAVRNVDAQSLPSIAQDLARLQLSGVGGAVLLVVVEAVGDLLRPRLLRLDMTVTAQPSPSFQSASEILGQNCPSIC